MQIKEAVLLIGGSGFIGSNILDYSNQNDELLKRYKFVVLSRGFEKYLNDSAIYVTGDYSDKNILINLFSKWNFKKVIHCASSTTPFSSKNNILSDINGNLIANPPLNPENNAFNGTNSFTGASDLYNMDLDVYNIQNNIHIAK